MNRERRLTGPNSYERELGFHPLDRLRPGGAWLDLCCGSGRALAQAVEQVEQVEQAGDVLFSGVDLVDYFDPAAERNEAVELYCESLLTWTPQRRFDLITCVHGLHYVGDKLRGLTRAASRLTDGGLLVADLDVAGIKSPDGPRGLTKALRSYGFADDPRRRRITCEGRTEAALPYVYVGADDTAGPNYTNQPAVGSYDE